MDVHERQFAPAGGRPIRQVVLAAVIAVAALAAGACSGDDTERADTESINSGDPAAGESAGDDGERSDGSDGSGDGEGTGEVLGTTRAQLTTNALDNRLVPLRLDVTRLERQGDLVELTLDLTNEAETPAGAEPQDYTAYSTFSDNDEYDAGGVGLVDGNAQKLYLPVQDSDGVCLCTRDLGNTDVPPGSTLTLQATFGGIPDDVEQLDVRVPNFPAINGVPVR